MSDRRSFLKGAAGYIGLAAGIPAAGVALVPALRAKLTAPEPLEVRANDPGAWRFHVVLDGHDLRWCVAARAGEWADCIPVDDDDVPAGATARVGSSLHRSEDGRLLLTRLRGAVEIRTDGEPTGLPRMVAILSRTAMRGTDL